MIVVTHEMGIAYEVADEEIFKEEGMIGERAPTKENIDNTVINVGTGNKTSMKELGLMISNKLNCELTLLNKNMIN